MAYGYSDIDRNNSRWMENDNSCATLRCIKIVSGTLRGLCSAQINFDYPITAFAGENGSGKSTVLAIAACGFHNEPDGYKLKDRNTPYYTFSDFFIQSRDEIPPEGIEIRYAIAHNDWHRSDPGIGWQKRSKRVGGRWTDYELRVDRNVIYFGINRVVPHFERSTHKSYRGRFRADALDEGIKQRICEIAGRIIGKTYDEYEIHSHSKYSLPVVSSGGITYSGFNMGAGESAVFEILTALFDAGRGALLVIDEIELGLHERAQSRLINELKLLCGELHCQIICSTHSHIILSCLPPEGRYFIESRLGRSIITKGISPDHACGLLRGENPGEISVYVEDGVAQSILKAALPHHIRTRTIIRKIGSSEAVLRQLAARYLEAGDNCVCILDGDQRQNHQDNVRKVRNYIETQYRDNEQEFNEWVSVRLTYMPSDDWPERWLLHAAIGIADKSLLVRQWLTDDQDIVENLLASAHRANKHSEFRDLSENLQLPEEQVRSDLVRLVVSTETDDFGEILQTIQEALAR